MLCSSAVNTDSLENVSVRAKYRLEPMLQSSEHKTSQTLLKLAPFRSGGEPQLIRCWLPSPARCRLTAEDDGRPLFAFM